MKSTKKAKTAKSPAARPTKVEPKPAPKPRGRPRKLRPGEAPKAPDAPATPEKPDVPATPEPAPEPQKPPKPQKPPTDPGDIVANLLLRLVSPLRSLPVQTNEGIIYLRPEDIAYITTTKTRHLAIIDRHGQEWLRFDSITAMYKLLAEDPRFFLAHQSFIINIFAIRSLRKTADGKRQEVTFAEPVPGAAAVAEKNVATLRSLIEL